MRRLPGACSRDGKRLLALAVGLVAAALPGGPARASLFVTGHDADYHAGRGRNAAGARHLLQQAIRFVTEGKPDPHVLLVTGLRPPPGEHYDPRFGLRWAGFSSFDVATATPPAAVPPPAAPRPGGRKVIVERPALDLKTVSFDDYDAVVIASDFGGWLGQAELDVLNNRAGELVALTSLSGRGLVVLPEGGRPGRRGGTLHHRYAFLPFLSGDTIKNRPETMVRLTPAGLSAGLAPEDVVGNTYHVVFKQSGSLEVLDVDGNDRAVTLVSRGEGGGGGGGAEAGADRDHDGVPDSDDNCPAVANADQSDLDHDGAGDACDPDADGDGVPDARDSCPRAANADQADLDHDGIGDACDPDADGDGVPNASDVCPETLTPERVPLGTLAVGRYAVTTRGATFSTRLPEAPRGTTPAPPRTLTLADTHGCTCAQILERKEGALSDHWNQGCTLQLLLDFIATLR